MAPASGTASGNPLAALAGKLRTAADLAESLDTPLPSAPSAVSPEVFAHGMHVQHPEYGVGQIVHLVGTGPKRTATVRFQRDGVEKKFRLAFSPLRPM